MQEDSGGVEHPGQRAAERGLEGGPDPARKGRHGAFPLVRPERRIGGEAPPQLVDRTARLDPNLIPSV